MYEGNSEFEQQRVDEEFCRIIAAEHARERIQILEDQGFERPDYTPVGLDPLSTARAYELAAIVHGPESYEAQMRYEVLRNDVRTALFEALIERGHISITHSTWDGQEQGFKVGDLLYRDLLERSFDDRLIRAEHERRVVEYHEELFIEQLYQTGLLDGKALLTISPYPDDMSEDWAKNLGYKAETRKYMLRWVEIEDGVRTTKQLSMSGSDAGVLNEFLRQQGYIGEENLTTTEILNLPILIEPDQFGDIVDVAQEIDAISGEGVFLGGEPNGDTYETLEAVSVEREQRLAEIIDTMVAELIEAERAYNRGEIAPSEQGEVYGYILLKTRNLICRIDPDLARESIGEKAYNKYKEAIAMVSRGETELDVDACIAEAERASNDVYVCGVSIDANGNEVGKPCPEIRNGQIGQCPGCKHTVSIIVEGAKKDKLYCPRRDCSLSKVGAKAAKAKQKVAAK